MEFQKGQKVGSYSLRKISLLLSTQNLGPQKLYAQSFNGV